MSSLWDCLERHIERIGAPPMIFGASLLASLLVRCANDPRGTAASSTPVDCVAAPTGSCAPPGPVGSASSASGGSGQESSGAGGVTPNDGSGGFFGIGGQPEPAGSPTVQSFQCSDAGAALDCPLPPSECEGTKTLVYFTQPSCAGGTCQWARQTYACETSCVNGACYSSSTSVGLPAVADGGTQCSSSNTSPCLLPPSECLDARHLLYFTDPRCAETNQGPTCRTEARAVECGGRGCANGGCLGSLTAPP